MKKGVTLEIHHFRWRFSGGMRKPGGQPGSEAVFNRIGVQIGSQKGKYDCENRFEIQVEPKK